jgi:MOB kinase activator 1
LWADGKEVKKPIKCSAPEYVDFLMTWIQSVIDDESVFPSHDGSQHISSSRQKLTVFFPSSFQTDTPFPKDFKSIVKTFFKRLFRVYAHMYYSHAKARKLN